MKAKEKQTPNLAAIRKAESRNGCKNSSKWQERPTTIMSTTFNRKNIGEKHKKHQINRKNKIQAGRQKQKEGREDTAISGTSEFSRFNDMGPPGPDCSSPMNTAHGLNTQLKPNERRSSNDDEYCVV